MTLHSTQLVSRARLKLRIMRNRAAERAAQECGVEWSYLFLNPSGDDMAQLLDWVDKGQVKPVIDSVWPFEEAKQAALRNFSGHAKGKCVVQVVPEEHAYFLGSLKV